MATAEITPGRAGLSAEWSLLLARCSAADAERAGRLDSLLQNSVDWHGLLTLADSHGVLPLLYRSVSSERQKIPDEAVRSLNARIQVNLHKAMVLARELLRVHDALSRKGIEVLPYKGVTLAEHMYGDIALRQMGDIDLLIRPDDLAHIKLALAELGYTPHDRFSPVEERAYLRNGYECTFDSRAGRNVLEVQWAMLPRFYAVNLDMNGVFRRAVDVTVAGHSLRTPSLEDQFLLLSIHAAKHVWARLIWLCDIVQIVLQPGLNWKWIQEQAEYLGIVRLIHVTLLLANKLLQLPLPKEFAELPDADAAALADEIALQITTGTEIDVESVSYFRTMLRLRERRSDRIRFLQRLVFTPGPNEWRAVRLPAPLFPLYHIVRLGRLARRFSGL